MFAGALRTGTSFLLIVVFLLACFPVELLHSHDGCMDDRPATAGASQALATFEEACDLCGHKILLERNAAVDHPVVATLVFPIHDDTGRGKVHVSAIALPPDRGPPSVS
jgi:hypothetical protein